MSQDTKKEVEEIRAFLKREATILKPVFGLMFWELATAESQMTPEAFAEQGMNLSLSEPDDEVIASFISTYIQLWLSSRDFNAASRFIAATLGVTADELLQARQIYRDATP